MSWRVAAFATLIVVNATLWLAGGVLARTLGDGINVLFGPRMIRAEVVVRQPDGIHDYRVDRGRIRSTATRSLTLAEKDGTIVTIPVAPGARITLNGVAVGYAALHRRLTATVVREGDQPASRVAAVGA